MLKTGFRNNKLLFWAMFLNQFNMISSVLNLLKSFSNFSDLEEHRMKPKLFFNVPITAR